MPCYIPNTFKIKMFFFFLLSFLKKDIKHKLFVQINFNKQYLKYCPVFSFCRYKWTTNSFVILIIIALFGLCHCIVCYNIKLLYELLNVVAVLRFDCFMNTFKWSSYSAYYLHFQTISVGNDNRNFFYCKFKENDPLSYVRNDNLSYSHDPWYNCCQN